MAVPERKKLTLPFMNGRSAIALSEPIYLYKNFQHLATAVHTLQEKKNTDANDP